MFQSTRPVWSATVFNGWVVRICQSFNPRAPYGARLLLHLYVFLCWKVSIHAPRMERDQNVIVLVLQVVCFNPRAPYGARPECHCPCFAGRLFQSTRPVWSATQLCGILSILRYVSIHAPRMERDPLYCKQLIYKEKSRDMR